MLWFFAQCLIYAGSIFGVSIYVQSKFSELKTSVLQQLQGTKKEDTPMRKGGEG